MLRYFFASANSGKGFINCFPQFFSPLTYHYIIKGGPGTGKSSLMRKIGEKALSLGMDVDFFLCSSDPDSIDGVIIKDIGVGITDGTAPHVSDPDLPGIKSEIINLGSYWDKSILNERKDIVNTLSKNKSKEFDLAYGFLSNALNVKTQKLKLIKNTVNYQKINSFCLRQLKKLELHKGECCPTFTNAITVKGVKTLDTFMNEAQSIYCFTGQEEISALIMKCLKEKLFGYEHFVSYDALDPESINMIYIPSCKTIFTKAAGAGRHINTKRFIDISEYKSLKNELKQTEAIYTSLFNMALMHLKNAGEIHFRLEENYIRAMDFKKKEEEQNRLIKEIFS